MLNDRELWEARYGRRHRELRKRAAAKVATGRARCARCGELIAPDEPFDLGHQDDGGPGEYSGPEHRACNRRTRLRPLYGERRTSRNW